MDEPDEVIKAIATQVRAAGGDVQHPQLRPRYLAYLEQKLSENQLLTEEIEHLVSLYNRLQSRDYFSESRPANSPELVKDLLGLMSDAEEKSLAGLVGKVFICHQIAEEWLFRLLKACQFLIDLRMGSYRIKHPEMETQNLNGMCNALQMYVHFPSREELIREARLINNIRNRIGHQILSIESVQGLQKLAEDYFMAFERLKSRVEDSFNELYDLIKDFRKWSDMFEDDLLALMTFELDDNGISYKDEDSFAMEAELVL